MPKWLKYLSAILACGACACVIGTTVTGSEWYKDMKDKQNTESEQAMVIDFEV